MAATQQPQVPDRTTEEIPAEPDNVKDQGTATIGHSRETTSQSRSFGSGGDRPMYSPNVFAPQAQPFYYRGFDNGNGEWDEYSSYVNSEGLELGSPGIYNENPSLVFHSGYGFNPQMPYSPYSPVTTPLPSVGGDAQLYSPQQFPYTGPPYYHQLVPPSLPYLNSPTPVSQPELTNLASHQQQSLYGFGSGSNSYGRGYLPNQGSSFGGTAISSLRTNDRSFLSLENSRLQGRAAASLCNCNGTLDILSEQNRGPRASKLKSQISSENNSADNSKGSAFTTKFQNESLNRPDFVTDYKDAIFFVIKSYSEDNVHKSIKYGVWASTPNGNRKLDAAYRQAKEKQDACPVFLFFSVNASAQFCGVAEMVGPVNFEKNVDFWQQDKWSGQFPVKWHIIKDVPNSQFRHIVLENNDNKPVTNSRDTQEVKLQQGIEMLTIFKNYETDVSILDDFDFYEDREKAMQERKARQQSSMMAAGIVGENEHNRSSVNNNTSDFIKQMSKTFALVVSLDENKNAVVAADRDNLASDGTLGNNAVKSDDGISVTASPSQSS